jgi:hypothetical protein
LRILARLERRAYPTGITVRKNEFSTIDLSHDDVHREWNYVITPRQ